MEGLAYLFVVGLAAAIFVAVKAFDFLANCHPLSDSEVLDLAEKRRRDRALEKYDFSNMELSADPSEKKSMKASGQLVNCNLSFYDAPARIAGMLKAKKHEWIVAAYVRSYQVPLLWWNKGPDGVHVYLTLSDQDILSHAKELGADAIAILHNHPNPYGNRATSEPSPNDVKSALTAANFLLPHGISLLEFVCDRGIPHLYFTAFSEAEEALEPILSNVQQSNGFSRGENYRLRKELREGEQSAGLGVVYEAKKAMLPRKVVNPG